MDRIHLLDDDIINKIAAGEVIERPASAVKELIENSLDAGSKKIFIDIRNGGKSLIKVSDDGYGMSRTDAVLSWQRHATSKIRDASDLFSINTLGFRGEALASIASVSELAIITREKDSVSGVRLAVKAGRQVSEESFGCPIGTIIEVRDLFFNTPARLKYLKSDDVEEGHVSDIVTRYALIHIDVHFRLTADGREIFDAPVSDALMRISVAYGVQAAKELVQVRYTTDDFSIGGYISKPSLSRASRSDQSIYINRRYIKKNHVVSDAIANAYHSMMMVGRFPLAVLNIDLSPEQVDVNVHPQKSEVRLKAEKDLYEAVHDAIKTALSGQDLIPMAEPPIQDLGRYAGQARSEAQQVIREKAKGYKLEDTRQELLKPESEELAASRLPELRILGIVNKTYILAEAQGFVLIIDQHAAAERILYERFTSQLRDKKVAVQNLLNPEVIPVTPQRFRTAVTSRDILAGLGYRTEEFGPGTIMVSTVPVMLGRQFDRDIFMDLLDDIVQEKARIDNLEKFFHARIARMACRTAIKAGDDITLPQIKEYIQQLMEKDVPFTCPHGRPILIKLSYHDLEKMFKRIV